MPGLKLYEIPLEISRIVDAVNEETGELTEEQVKQLAALDVERSVKIDAICGLIAEWNSINVAKQAQIDRLKKGMEVHNNAIKRLKEYLLDHLQVTGVKKIDTELWSIWQQNSPPSATCTVPAECLPSSYQITKIEPNNKAAIEYWKKHNQPPAGFEINQGTHLRIK